MQNQGYLWNLANPRKNGFISRTKEIVAIEDNWKRYIKRGSFKYNRLASHKQSLTNWNVEENSGKLGLQESL